ncbi:MAG: putative selenate reductase subunit YgfK [Anaerolineae bacterium]
MSDKMRAQPFDVLLDWILKEFEENQSIFGIPRSLFYTPKTDSPYAVQDMFGYYLATPIGPAAGPHTQLAQNIVCAWLSGGRFIELKTVQILDELEIPRPCIDMEDEGYNVEWSQELKLEQSANEYIKAWVLIHILHRLLGFEGEVPLGTVFNMSVGYNLAGIQSPPMARFMERMVDASEEIAKIQDMLRRRFPQFADIEIPTQLTNNVTLSTMHGCPPDEIERIVRYLLEERGLHTTVKLNPTLLGKDMVMHILHERLGFREIYIPDAVFEHDLQYDRAVQLIRTLKQVAAEHRLTFGVKLSNTLAMANHKGLLPGNEMYMSGRALYPITMNLFYKLAQEFNGDLNVSYSAGADALNISTILACGACPVTAVTDLLKPGGYSRLLQFLENLEQTMRERGVSSLEEFAKNKMADLEKAAHEALEDPRYKKSYRPYGLPKVESGLGLFDCITAPCKEQCPVRQDVPEYVWWIAKGEYDRALEVILSRNPLPGVTGYICTHLCQTRCTRNNYDQPVAIRALKRIAAEKGRATVRAKASSQPGASLSHRRKVAVIGSGPSGLAAAYFLALNGVQVTIYEAKDKPGGMLRIAPAFRLPAAVVQRDIDRIIRMGVKVELSHPIAVPPEELLQQGFDAVYIACGFAKDAPLDIEGIEARGVFFALDFLERVASGEKLNLGAKVLVIGGGNTAMDAARTARRLTGKPVTVVYRRTQHEMPASEEEIGAFFAEGNHLIELASPVRVIVENGRVAGLECVHNRLGEPGADGRREPVRIEGSEFVIWADSIIVAIGQRPDITFLDGSSISLRKDGAIVVESQSGRAGRGCIYAGGDAVRGPATVIEACADGQHAAEAICAELGIEFSRLPASFAQLSGTDILQIKRARARKESQHKPEILPPAWRNNFDLIERTLTESAARSEAARCLQCSTLCDKCVEVCPNRANYAYTISPMRATLPKLSCYNGQLIMTGEQTFQIEQSRQIIHVDDFCNECGNCATFCVHQGKPYREKPRLFLDESDFALEESNAFYICRNGKGWAIRRREGGKESRLFAADGADEAIFDNDWLTLTFSVPAFRIKAMALKHEFPGEFWAVSAAEMYVILRGVTDSLPFLPFGHR